MVELVFLNVCINPNASSSWKSYLYLCKLFCFFLQGLWKSKEVKSYHSQVDIIFQLEKQIQRIQRKLFFLLQRMLRHVISYCTLCSYGEKRIQKSWKFTRVRIFVKLQLCFIVCVKLISQKNSVLYCQLSLTVEAATAG